MAITDRFQGYTIGVAVKPPCTVASTANITLSGSQTVDGISVGSCERVLVKSQTDSKLNGIYIADTSTWRRAADWDGRKDAIPGTQVYVDRGTAFGRVFFAANSSSTAVSIDIGATGDEVTFSQITPSVTDVSAGTVQALNSTAERTLEARFSEFTDIQDFGAVEGGLVDCTTATQDALNKKSSIVISSGTWLFSEKFQYSHEGGTAWGGAVDVPSSRTVHIKEGARIISSESSAGYRGIFVVNKKENVRFTGGGHFDGQHTATNSTFAVDAAISVHASSNITIEDLSAQDFAQHGFAIYADQSAGCENVEFRNLIIENGAQSCLMAFSSVTVRNDAPNKFIRAINCSVKNSTSFYGIEFRGAQQSLIKGCKSQGNAAGGYNIEENYQDVHVVDCFARSEGSHGFVANGSSTASRLVLERCGASDNAAAGITLATTSPDTKIINCVSTGNTGIGINIGTPDSTGTQVVRCVVVGNGGGGISVRSNDCWIERTYADGNTGSDLSISSTAQRTRMLNNDITSFSYNSSNVKVGGLRMEVDDSSAATILHLESRYVADEEYFRIRGTAQSGDKPYGAIDFTRTGASGGETRLYSVNATQERLVASAKVNGDLEMDVADRGLVVVAPNGTDRWRINVDNTGTVVTSSNP